MTFTTGKLIICDGGNHYAVPVTLRDGKTQIFQFTADELATAEKVLDSANLEEMRSHALLTFAAALREAKQVDPEANSAAVLSDAQVADGKMEAKP